MLFQEALSHVPKNALVIEVAPHCLLQAVLKRSIGNEGVFVGLMKRDQQDEISYLLTSLGKSVELENLFSIIISGRFER